MGVTARDVLSLGKYHHYLGRLCCCTFLCCAQAGHCMLRQYVYTWLTWDRWYTSHILPCSAVGLTEHGLLPVAHHLTFSNSGSKNLRFCFWYTSLSLAENLGHHSWVRHRSCKSSATHSYQCVFSCVRTMVQLPAFGIVNVPTDVDACSCTRGLYGQGKRPH